MNILIIGTGSFSQALSHCLKNHKVSFLSRGKNQVLSYPVYNSFPDQVFDLIVLGIPRNALSSFLQENRQKIHQIPLLFVSKGFDENNYYDPIQECPELKNQALYFLGPNLASEIISSLPTYSVLCAYNPKLLSEFLPIFQENPFLHCEPSESPKEILLGCALKNIYTLGYGYIQKNESFNSSALYFVNSLEEIQKWYKVFSLEFHYSKAVIGDYFVSCIGPSRNKLYGLNFPNNSNHLVEGLNSLKNLYKQYPNQFPLFEKLYKIFCLNQPISLI